jgi:hypothetical protein
MDQPAMKSGQAASGTSGSGMHSFIIHIWQEEETGENLKDWRGSIDYVGNDKRLYFRNPEGILPFIESQIGVRLKPTPRTWKHFLRSIVGSFHLRA